jgi:hypothetical protein
VGESRIDLPRVHRTALPDERQHRIGLRLPPSRPRVPRRARMHELTVGARQESIVDEEVLLQSQPWISALEIARPIVVHAVPQGQVLRPRRRPDRIRLHIAELVDGSAERRRPE